MLLIGTTTQQDNESEEHKKPHSITSVAMVENASVVGVKEVFTCNLCFRCGGIVITDICSKDIGQCNDCDILQYLDETKTTTGAHSLSKCGKASY